MAARRVTAVEKRITEALPEILRQIGQLNTSHQYKTIATGDQLFGTLTLANRPIKPFIIGFIPPDIEVNFVPVERDQKQLSAITSNPAKSTTPANAEQSSVTAATTTLSSGNAKPASSLPDSFYTALAQTARNIGASPADLLLVLYSESGLNPAAANHVDGDKNKPIQALGINQITPIAVPSSGMTMDFWKNGYGQLSAEEQLPYAERYFKSMYKGAYSTPDQLYVVNFAPAYIAKAQDRNAVLYPQYNKDGSINNNWKQNKGLNPNGDITVGDLTRAMYANANRADFKSQLARLESVVGKDAAYAKNAPSGSTTPLPSVTVSGAPSNAAADSTSAPASADVESPTEVGKIMYGGNITDPETGDPLRRTGRNIRVSNTRSQIVQQQVDELNNQINAVKNIPPLLMLVNPSSFNRSYEPTIDKPKARAGHVVQMWLERPLTISCSGQSAGQYVVDASGSGGITHQNRLHSLSYKNVMSLALMYRNNGVIYSGDSIQSLVDAGNSGIPILAMSMFIYFDGHVYIGSFDDFSITDAAEKPFTLSYSWKFTARYDVDVSSITDTIINRILAGSTRTTV